MTTWTLRRKPCPCEYTQLIFDKGAKAEQWRKDSCFNKWCWNNWTSIYKKKKKNLVIHFTSLTTINSKLIIDLNVKPKRLKLKTYIKVKTAFAKV